jgi:hypothetical protein
MDDTQKFVNKWRISNNINPLLKTQKSGRTQQPSSFKAEDLGKRFKFVFWYYFFNFYILLVVFCSPSTWT